jgi:hypothetical protein
MNNEPLQNDSTTVKKADLIKNACNDLQHAFRNQLKDLFRAEKKLAKALPKISMASNSKDRKEAYKSHLEQTKTQVRRLDLIFELLGKKTGANTNIPAEITNSETPGMNNPSLHPAWENVKEIAPSQHVHFNSLKAITGLLNMKECHRLASFNGNNNETHVIPNVHNVSVDVLEINGDEIQVA